MAREYTMRTPCGDGRHADCKGTVAGRVVVGTFGSKQTAAHCACSCDHGKRPSARRAAWDAAWMAYIAHAGHPAYRKARRENEVI